MMKHFGFPFWLSFALVVALGAFLRLWDLGAESLRLDEAQSVWQASHSFEFIRTYMLKNVHLPLHNTLLHVWMGFFGSSEVAVRLLAVIPGILFLPALYLLARQFLSRNWALMAMLFSALAPFFVWYSREIRMYSLLMLASALSYYFFIKILRDDKVRWYVGYFAINLIGIYTHYFFMLVLLSQAVFFFLSWKTCWNGDPRPRKETLSRLWKLSLVAGLLLAAFSPWLYGLYSTYGSGSLAPILSTPTSFNIILSLFEFIFGFQPTFVTGAIIALWPLLTLLGFIFLAKRQERVSEIFAPGTWFLILAIALPLLLTFAVSATVTPLFLTRYVSIAAPMVFILITWLVAYLPRGQAFAGAVLILTLSTALAVQELHPENPAKEDYRGIASYLSETVAPRDIVVLAPPYLLYPLQYYYEGRAQVTTVPIWDKRQGAIPPPTPERLEADSKIIKGSRERIFLVVGSDLFGALESKDYFDNHYTKLDKIQFSHNLSLHIYQAEYLASGSTTAPSLPAEPGAVTPPLSSDARVHIVRPGDTVSELAEQYYGESGLIRPIVEANVLQNPDLIHPGERLRIPLLP